jgi:acetylornithine deacetylase/succinyl-diaminopimelate desuccinylase-like protein
VTTGVRPSPTHARLFEVIESDERDLVDLCVELGNTSSPHGHELEVATKAKDWFSANGIRSWLQPITDRSANTVAVIPGVAPDVGKSLILDAHLDTGKPLRPDAPERLRRIEGAWTKDGLVYGLGVVNDKGQLACFMIAARALLRAGLSLNGDLTVAGVAFETGAPSVGARQGIDYPGEGFGTWWLVNRGVTADYALVGETSGFGIIAAECGALGVLVKVRGRFVYTPRMQRGSSLTENPNSVVGIAHVVIALEQWAVEYERRSGVQTRAGTIVPKAQIMSIEGSPAESTIQLDVRLAPGANPRTVQRDLEKHVRTLGLACEVTAYQWSRGYVAENAEPLIAAVRDAHVGVFGTPPQPPPTPEISMWRDLNMFNEVGIPSVCYGPPRQREEFSDARNRAVKIADLVAATKVYALTALAVCGEARGKSDG